MNKLKWVAVVAAAAVLLVVGGTWTYINVIRDDPPERLAFDADETAEPDSTTTTSGTSVRSDPESDPEIDDDIEGTWTLTRDSIVGYRVNEILFGQTATGAGRTSDVNGGLTIDGTTVAAASFEVDMATFVSDDNRRDNQFRGRIMDTDSFPTATLVLAEPIELGSTPADREIVEVTATVELTLRGTTRTIPIDLRARRNGPVIEIDGSTTIMFADWDIPNPSTTGITTEDQGELEFVLVFARS